MKTGSAHLIALAGAAAIAFGWNTASADTTAVYESPARGLRFTIECAANGDVRESSSNPSDPGYWLIRDGVEYLVRSTPHGFVADRASDLAGTMVEIAAKRDPKKTPFVLPRTFDVIARGSASINGRIGTAYYTRVIRNGFVGAEPEAVISGDPALAPIGHALARIRRQMPDFVELMTGASNPFVQQLNELLDTGGPLVFDGGFIGLGTMELDTVSLKPIPASRFDLPGAPEPVDQIRSWLEQNPPNQTPSTSR
jgi:hypothetical protein